MGLRVFTNAANTNQIYSVSTFFLSQMQIAKIKYSVSTYFFATNANNNKKSDIQFRRYFCHKKNKQQQQQQQNQIFSFEDIFD